MTARERLLKKRPRHIDIDGEKIPVRSLTIAEHLQVESLNKTDQQAAMSFILSRAVLEDDGSQAFVDENDTGIQDIPFELVPLITEKIQSLSKTKPVESIVKNSDATP